MQVSESITRIRRYVKDTDGNVFSDARLLRMYNEVRARFIRESLILVRGAVVANPPRTRSAFTYGWERAYATEPSLRWAFFEGMNDYAVTQRWEAEQLQGVTPTTTGGYHLTSGADTPYALSDNYVQFDLPTDFYAPIMAAWRGKIIYQEPMADLRQGDWHTHQSDEVQSYAIEPWFERFHFFPYPRPTVESLDMGNNSGGGVPVYISDVENYGSSLALSAGTLDPEGLGDGVIVELLRASDGFAFFFYRLPTDVSLTDTDSIPQPFIKYVEYGTAALALLSDTEMKNQEASTVLYGYYKGGLKITQALKERTQSGVERRLRSAENGHGRSHALGRPKFPSSYPKVW